MLFKGETYSAHTLLKKIGVETIYNKSPEKLWILPFCNKHFHEAPCIPLTY